TAMASAVGLLTFSIAVITVRGMQIEQVVKWDIYIGIFLVSLATGHGFWQNLPKTYLRLNGHLAYGHFLLNAQRLASIGGLYIVFQFTQSFTIAGLSSVVPSGVVSILLNRRYQERNFAFSALNSYVIAIKGNFKHCFTASAFVLSNSLV